MNVVMIYFYSKRFRFAPSFNYLRNNFKLIWDSVLISFHFSLIPMQSYSIFILVSFHFSVIPFQSYICIPFWSYSILVLFHFCLIQLYLFYFVHIRLKCPRSVRTYVTWILSSPNFRCVNSKAFDTQLLDPSIKDINDHSRSNSYYLVPNIMHKKDLSLGYVYYIFVFRSNL